jgi:hypothetical protein
MSVFGSDVESKATLDAVIATLDADELQALKAADAMITAHRQAFVADIDALLAKHEATISATLAGLVDRLQVRAEETIQSLDGWRIEISVGGSYGTLVAPQKGA